MDIRMQGNHRVKEPHIPYNPPICLCRRAKGTLGPLNGRTDKPFWDAAEWMDDFHDIEGAGKPKPFKRTRVKMLWDDEALYIAAVLEDDTIWATVRNRDEVIFVDNDFEVFLSPGDSTHRYYELEINAHNAVWDLYMHKPQRDCVNRIISWDIRGLETAVHIDGELNNPSADNKSWSIEMKIPWFSLRECGVDQCYPEVLQPSLGETWRLNFSRVEYEVDVVDNRYVKRACPETGKPLPEYNWVWAPTGIIDIHLPEMWGYLIFTDHGESYPLPADEGVKRVLRTLYYRQHAHRCVYGHFSTDADSLLGKDADGYKVQAYVTPSLFEGIAVHEGRRWHIREDGYLWCSTIE